MAAGANISIPPSWVSKMRASPNFNKYLSLSKKPNDQQTIDMVTKDCVREVTNYFSVDFALDVRAFYDLDLFIKYSSEVQTPGAVISHVEGNTFSIFVKPQDFSENWELARAVIILDLVECITKSLIGFLFPDSNKATIDFLTAIIMWEKIFNILVSEKEKNDVRLNIQSVYGQEIQEINVLTRESSLSCPHCQSHSLEFIGLQNTGTVEYQGGVPVLSGKKENVIQMAFYKCKKCMRIFYIQPQKM